MKGKHIYYFSIALFLMSSGAISILWTSREDYITALLGPVSLLFLLICPLASKILKIKFGFYMKSFVILFSCIAFNIGTGLGWYELYENYSFFVHGISGILFTIIGFFIYYIVRNRTVHDLRKDWLLILSYAFFFSMTVAVFWETAEYITYITTGRDVQHTLTTGVHDTMLDLISCIAGSIILLAYYLIYVRTGKKSFFIRLIDEFYENNEKGI